MKFHKVLKEVQKDPNIAMHRVDTWRDSRRIKQFYFEDGGVTYLYDTYDKEIWLPTNSDLFATDWVLRPAI